MEPNAFKREPENARHGSRLETSSEDTSGHRRPKNGSYLNVSRTRQTDKLKKSLKLLLEHADYNDKMKYVKVSIINIERCSVKDRLSKVYYPTGDGGFEDIPGWMENTLSSLVQS